MRKLYEFFKVLQFQKRIVAAKRSLRRIELGIDYANWLKDCFRILQIDLFFIDQLGVLLRSQFSNSNDENDRICL